MEGVGEVAGGCTKTGGRRKEGAAILLSRRLEAQSGRESEAWLPPPRPLKLHCLVQPPPHTHTHTHGDGAGEKPRLEETLGRNWEAGGGRLLEIGGSVWGGENWRAFCSLSNLRKSF